MKKFNLAALAILACAAFIILTACKAGDQAGSGRASATSQTTPTANAQQPTAPVPDDGVERISIADAQKAAANGEAVFIDVRGSIEYERGHIKGAISLPRGQIKDRAGELPKDKLLITYCA